MYLIVLNPDLKLHRQTEPVPSQTTLHTRLGGGAKPGGGVLAGGRQEHGGRGRAAGRRRGEGQVRAARVRHVAHAQVVHQLVAQVPLLLALVLQGVEGLLQLCLGDVLQPHRLVQLAVQELRLLRQHLGIVLQGLVLHLGEEGWRDGGRMGTESEEEDG